MCDIKPLILIGIDDSVKKTISGFLYMYKWQKQKRDMKHFRHCNLVDNSGSPHSPYQLNKNLIPNDKNEAWSKYFCVIKANILFVYYMNKDTKPVHIFLLEGASATVINFHMAIKLKLIEEDGTLQLGENMDILQLQLNDQDKDCKCYFYTSNIAAMQRWYDCLNNSSFVNMQKNVDGLTEENKALKMEMKNAIKLKDLDLRKKEIEINDLRNQIQSLENILENTETKNRRLQIAAEVNIKSTDEMLQKKISEMEIIHEQLGQKIEENLKLEEKLKQAKDETNRTFHLVNCLKEEKKVLTKKMNKILDTYKDACDEPEKIALINFNTNERYQKLVLNNKSLKEEVLKLNERFYKLEDEYKEKIKILKEVVEMGDVFDYLHKLILLCQTKIKYYEKGYTYNAKEEQKMKTTICNLIKETKVSETNARVCYIRHRSKVLEEKINHYINRLPASEYFYFACTVLKRLGWIFGEIESLNPLIGEHGEEYPFFSYKGEREEIPLREQIYFNEGIEGRSSYNIVNEVDVYSFPKKMCPYQDKLLSDNNYNYIKIKLTDMKKDFHILKKKHKPPNLNDISDLRWEEIKKHAFERLEHNLLMLEKRASSRL